MSEHFLPWLKFAFGVPIFAWWPVSAVVAGLLVYTFVRQWPPGVLSASGLVLYGIAPFTLSIVLVALGAAFVSPGYHAPGSRIGAACVAAVTLLAVGCAAFLVHRLRSIRLFAFVLASVHLLFAASATLTAYILIYGIDLSWG